MKKNLKFKINNSEFGFTLVELLIVVSIIAILSTLLTANFIGVRQRSRDAHRKSDLRQIQSALELYRSDQGNYPQTVSFPACGQSLTFGSNVYLQKMPCDSGVSYPYVSNGSTYSITTCLENANDSDKDATNTCSNATYSYSLYNP